MLKEYYSIIQSKEYDKLKEYFSNPVERYYDSYNISPDKVVENFFIYLKKYPFQQLTVDYNSLSISKKPASYTLIYNAVFLLKKKETDNFQQYDITMDVTLNTDFKITSIYEKKNSKKNIGASSENPEVTSSNKAMQLTINGSKVNIRALPNLKASVMFQLNTGDVCVIIENGNWENINGNIDRWYKINYNGKIGWVYGSFVNIENNNIKVKQKIPQGRS